MKLPRTSHTDQPWRIHTLIRDFKAEDVRPYRTPGAGPDRELANKTVHTVYPALTRQWERAWRDRALRLPEGTSPQS
ncbi:hypothetical protein ABT390_10310 [Streptomyces aurantiacus]|uniref:Uncharacterized protein n=1 Tax=Streptomyces aurantiacus JA 4570 TaxID=1286094 RepID=S3ZYQ6_9ACTN|nr:hypothetical protein [Streptomyces aurantiacus]EPH43555.1 hypothetical protein STRAU_3379 [Streptomyces aurantiacus JA 4570]